VALDQASKFCKRCNKPTLHARPGTNHILHLLLTVLTLGFWIPVWVLSSIRIGGWRCQTCGYGGSLLAKLALPVICIAGVIIFIVSWSSRSSNQTKPFQPITNVNIQDPPKSKTEAIPQQDASQPQTYETKIAQTQTPTPKESEKPKEEIKPKIFKEGESINVGYTAYGVWHSWWSNRLSDNQFLNQRPNARYLFVELTVQNNDKKARMVPPFTLLDENNQEYEASSNGWAVQGSIGVLESLNPSVSKQGFVVFDVPYDHTYRLKLSGGYWSLQDAYVRLNPKSSRDATYTEAQEEKARLEIEEKAAEKKRQVEIARQAAKELAEENRKIKTRTWTDVTGKFSTEAEFLYVTGKEVSLKKADGKTIKIALEKLSPDGQKWIEDWRKKGKK
jgi:outer membrane biosynthesis protein TonB